MKWIMTVMLAMAAVGMSAVALETRYSTDHRLESFLYLPQGPHAKLMSLGQEELVGDFILMRGTVYFGEHYREYVQGKYEYEWLYHIFDVVTDFDPWYYDAYVMGAHLLDDPHKAIALYEKGHQQFPEDYKMLESIGFQYFYELHDKGKAAEYYDRASRMPGHPPPYVASLADKFYRDAGSDYYLSAISVLKKAAENTDRPAVKKEFLLRARELEEVLKLQRQVEVFKVVQKRLPTTLTELFLFGAVSQVFMKSPDGLGEVFTEGPVFREDHKRSLLIDQETGKVIIHQFDAES